MKRYPVLTRQQTEEGALLVLRNGGSLQDLRAHVLFQPHLEKEKRERCDPKMYRASPVRSYEQLFADSPTIGNLVAFGNFPTLFYWVRQYATTYKGLPLDLEEFMQQALVKFIPDAARSYAPERGAPFKKYISTMLMWKLADLVDACVVERSMLPSGEKRGDVKPKQDTRRVTIGSLDATLPELTDNDDPVSLYDVVGDTHEQQPGESLARSSALRRLYRLAGITTKEAKVLRIIIFEGEGQEYAASVNGVTTRTIRYRRDTAVEKLRNLGWETVRAELLGDTPSRS
jgi:DNA-directed RNA polymerase specialized sigma24 family protein